MAGKTFVCRCEDVTLAEVQEALDRGYDDLESIKRFTGLGTGFCQGKQCVALAARLVHEQTGEAPTYPITPRPPLHPLPLGELARLSEHETRELTRPVEPADGRPREDA